VIAGRKPRLASGLATVAIVLGTATPAFAEQQSVDIPFTASDGVVLRTTLTGEAPLAARPTIVEFSPYGPGTRTFVPGPDYNSLLVQIRGTGASDGRFDVLGPQTQADVAQALRWACHQPWSGRKLALNGFSASAIAVYNSLHQRLPCVRTAVLKSGTFELYRDLLYPGGISNTAPGLGVLAVIGVPALAQTGQHPDSTADTVAGLGGTFAGVAEHPTLDSWWRRRGFRGDVNRLPILMIGGFFDVEARGAFQAYQALRRDGAHLMAIGAHDGALRGTDGGSGETEAWFDRYLRGVANGVQRHPRVRLWLADGGREDALAGRFVRYRGSDWPIRGTRWKPMALAPGNGMRGGESGNGSLRSGAPRDASRLSYVSLPSLPSSTDPPNTAIVGPFGINALATAFPLLTETNLAGSLGLSFTSRPFRTDVLSAGPLGLDLRLSSTARETGIWAVISDVWPNGTAHPLTVGRLSNSYPRVNRRRSLRDRRTGALTQPYGDYSRRTPPASGQERRYHVELWPVGNRFKAGHRLRLDIVGTSAASAPGVPAVNTVTLGGPKGSRLMFPVLPGSSVRSKPGRSW
jgi:uncharacterized protein